MSILNFFSKFNVYYSNFKKKEKEFQCQKQVMFQSTKWFGFGVQDNLNKRERLLFKKKERKKEKFYRSLKNHIERKAYKNENLKYKQHNCSKYYTGDGMTFRVTISLYLTGTWTVHHVQHT